MKIKTEKKRIFLRVAMVVLASFLVWFFTQSQTRAAITKQISYQGKLTNASDVAVPDGSYSVVFSIYTTLSGGTSIWTTTRNVSVSNGIFSVMLGDTSAGDPAINLDFNTAYYLGVKVGSDSEMSPRKTIGAAAYAFNADLLDGMDAKTSGADAHIVSTDASGNLTISGNTYFANGTTYKVDGSGNATFNAISTNSSVSAKSADGTKAMLLWHDGSNGIIATDAGNLVLGSATSNIFSGANLIPLTDNAYDIGIISTNRWKNLFLAGDASANNLILSGNIAVNGGGVTSTGAIGFTPASGYNVNFGLAGASAFSVNISQFYVDTATGNVGIGTTDAIASLHISSGTTVNSKLFTQSTTNKVVLITNQGASISSFNAITANSSGAGYRGSFIGTRAGGTLDNPTVPTSGDNVVSLIGAVYDGVTTLNTGIINMLVDGAVSAGNAPLRMEFTTTPNTLANRAARLVILSGGNIGIGTTAPSTIFHVAKDTSSGGSVQFVDGFTGSTANGANISIRTSRGTSSAMLRTKANDSIGMFNFRGSYAADDASAATFEGSRTSGISGIATENHTVAAQGSAIFFETTPNGTTTPLERLRINQNGYIGIGTGAPESTLHLSGNDNQYITLQSAGNSTSKGFILFKKSNGTIGSETAIANNDMLGQIALMGSIGSNSYDSARRAFEISASENWTTLTGGYDLTFWSRPNAQSSLSSPLERMRIKNSGYVGIGTSNPLGELHIATSNTSNVWRGITSSIHTDSATAGNFILMKSRGTNATPTSIQNADNIGNLAFSAYVTSSGADTSDYKTRALIQSSIDGTIDPASNPISLPMNLKFSTGATASTERMRITSGGFVGIGTANPAASLQVADSGTTFFRGLVTSQFNDGGQGGNIVLSKARGTSAVPTAAVSGDNIGSIAFASYDGSVYSRAAQIGAILMETPDTQPKTDMVFTTNDGSALFERMRIVNNGNIGIGTATPVSQLNVVSETTLSSRGIVIDQYSNNAASAMLAFRKSRGTLASPAIVSNGDYTGGFSFQNYTGSGTSYLSNAGFAAYVNGAVTASSIPTDLFFYTAAAGTTNAVADGVVRMTITSSGNVGMGTTSPSEKLEINGNIKVAYGSGLILPNTLVTDSDVQFKNTSTLANFAMLAAYPASSAANVGTALQVMPKGTGWGASIKSQVTVFNTDFVADSTNYESFTLRAAGAKYVLSVGKAGTSSLRPLHFEMGTNLPKLVIDTNGNIGIGTTSPTSNLEVSQSTTGSGTVSNSAGGTTVTGVGTQFTNTFKIGDTITINGQTVSISAIASDTSMTTSAITNANSNVAYTLSGGSRFVVKGNGSVGIGTVSPTSELDIKSSLAVGNNPAMQVFDINGVARFTQRTNGVAYWQLNSGTGEAGQLAFSTPGGGVGMNFYTTDWTNRLDFANYGTYAGLSYNGVATGGLFMLNTSGNIGIGTTSPSEKLEVNGNIKVSAGGKIIIPATTVTGSDIQFSNAAALNNYAVLTAYPSTSVTDSGTSLQVSPKGAGYNANIKSLISIFNTDFVADSTNYEFLGVRAAGAKYTIGASNNGTGSLRPLHFEMGTGQPKLVIDTNGNIGVGTTTPIAQFSVVSESTSVNRGISVDQYSTNASSATMAFKKARGTNAAPVIVSDGDYTGGFTFNNYSGSAFLTNAGVATYVNGTVTASSIPTDVVFYTSAAGTTNPVGDGAVRLAITSAGNVGIGTTAPATMLDVNGTSTFRNTTTFRDHTPHLITTTTQGYMATSYDATTGAGAQNVFRRADGTEASPANTKNNMALGAFSFRGHDGSVFTGSKGFIQAVATQDWTATANGTSFRISTTANNSTTLTERMRIDQSGYVGIGAAATPGYILDVQHASSKINSKNGYLTNGADYAEYFYTNDIDLKPGETVCVDLEKENAVKRCKGSGDNNVMGIVSTNPSIVGNGNGRERDDDPHYKVIGMLGQVPANVSNENGTVQVGDSLTSAEIPGYLRKANAGESTVGVAMQNLRNEKGSIKVLISRRNKSLTVEKVEDAVSQRIADMDIEDKINVLISDANQSFEDRMDAKFTEIEDLSIRLQQQMEELRKITNQDLLSAKVDLASQDIDYLKLVLGIDADKPGNISIMGKFKTEGIETGTLTIVIKDEARRTTGTNYLAPIQKDEDKDGIDDETGNDGKSYIIKTGAVNENSKIYLTPLGSTSNQVIYVGKVVPHESFEVKVDAPVDGQIRFNWWIVQEGD